MIKQTLVAYESYLRLHWSRGNRIRGLYKKENKTFDYALELRKTSNPWVLESDGEHMSLFT